MRSRQAFIWRASVFCAALASLGAAWSLAAPPDARDGATKANLKLLTWNIQMLPVMVGIPELQKGQNVRAPWIIEYLNRQDYDIVVLQEVIDRAIAARLKEGLKPRYPYIVAADAKMGISGTSGGILFASRVPLKYISHIVYKNIAGVDAMAEKGCLLVEAEVSGVRFRLAGTHLQAGHDDVRDREFPEISDRILQPNLEEGVPQFLAGDMNVGADEESFRLLLETTGMRDFPLDDSSPYTVDGKNSWNRATKRPKRIDYVLLNPRGTKTTIVRQTVQRARKEHDGKTIDLADHYGVVAEILLRK